MTTAFLRPLVLLALSGTCLAQETTAIIADTGDVAPQTGGEIIGFLSTFRVNANGELYTRLSLERDSNVTALNDAAAYLWRDGAFELIYRDGEPAFGVPGYVYLGAVPAGPSDSGSLAFRMAVRDLATSDEFNVIYAYEDGEFTEITREGAEGFGLPGTSIRLFDYLSIGPNGDISFLAELLTGNGIDSRNNRLSMARRSGVLERYARTEDPAPEVTGGLYGNLGRATFAPNGDLYFATNLTGESGFPIPFSDAAYTLTGTTPELLFFEGNPIEIAPNQRLETVIPIEAVSSGDYAVRAFLADFPFEVSSDNDEIFARVRDGVYDVAFREGQALDDFTGGTLLVFFEARTNEALDIAVHARVELPNPIPDVEAIYLSSGGESNLIVAERDPAPGMPGREFQIVEDSMVMNAMGDIVFEADIADIGAPVFSGDRSLVLYNAVRNELRIVAMAPSQIDADPDPAVTDLRNVVGFFFEFDDFNNASGYHGLGDGRQVAYTLTFDDGSQRSYLLTLNDPDTGACCLPGHRTAVVTEPRCAELNGIYAGDGVFDPVSPCSGLAFCEADFDGDLDVDLEDFGVFGGAFGSVVGDMNYLPEADFDGDGDVDLGDFGVFGAQFGSTETDCS